MTDLDKTRSTDELTDYLSRIEPPGPGPYRRPRDSATLIVLDGAPSDPKVLLGKRNERHAFMPGKFVFPGGAVDATDSRMDVAGTLDPGSERRLRYRLSRPSAARIRALALAAIRETCEETGLLIGRRDGAAAGAPSPAWSLFVDSGLRPNLGALTFVARAITPPGRPRRFDARFFVAHRRDIAAELPSVVGPDSELVELRWLSFADARETNLPLITRVVLSEIESRLRADSFRHPPVPFYYYRRGRAHRDEID
ncbi:MAG TPA: NUDIX hydrolase [Xanthobacteraceae bacterium]|jgi:8-oxo-dGTP pyrophosphatase MutT (NUDIX family)